EYLQQIVLGDDIAVSYCHRRIVHRIDGDVDVGGGARPEGIGQRIGEAVGAVEVQLGRIGEGAVPVVHHTAMGGLGEGADSCGGQRLVGVAVIGQHVRGDRRVLVGDDAVICCNGGIVDRGDLDAHGDGIALELAVCDRIGEAVGAVEICRRLI